MTGKAEGDLQRWRDRSPGKHSSEDRAAALIQGAMVPGEPDATALARIELTLHRGRRPPLHTRRIFQVGFALLFLVAGVASVKAYELMRKAGWLRPDAAPAAEPATARRVAARRPASAGAPAGLDRTLAPVAPESPTAEPQPEARSPDPAVAVQPALPVASRGSYESAKQTRPRPSVNAPKRLPDERPMVDVSNTLQPALPAPSGHAPRPPAVPVATAATDEIATLDRAMALLRRDRNADAALVALDSYLARFPNGILNREARFGRVDALLLLRRADDALAALDSLPLDSHRRSTELRVIRGELRARKDCVAAVADFTQAMAHSPDAVLLERILYGRGTCLAKTADRLGAASDLRRYLERFPQGAHAAWARRWLESSSPTQDR